MAISALSGPEKMSSADKLAYANPTLRQSLIAPSRGHHTAGRSAAEPCRQLDLEPLALPRADERVVGLRYVDADRLPEARAHRGERFLVVQQQSSPLHVPPRRAAVG